MANRVVYICDLCQKDADERCSITRRGGWCLDLCSDCACQSLLTILEKDDERIEQIQKAKNNGIRKTTPD